MIQWDHLQYTGFEEATRSWMVNLVCLVLLAIGVVCIIFASAAKEKMDYLSECPNVVQFPFAGDPSGTHFCDGLPHVDWKTKQVDGKNAKATAASFHASKTDQVAAAQFYKRAWDTTTGELPDQFPLLEEAVDGQCRLAGKCCASKYIRWNESATANGGESCLRVDTNSSRIYKHGSRDAICYACVCSKKSLYSELLGFEEIQGCALNCSSPQTLPFARAL